MKNKVLTQRPTRNAAQRQLILDEASLLFIKKGFAGTNLHEIADAAGLTRTAIYHYFPSKESILEALTAEVTEEAGLLAQSVAERDPLPAHDALRQLILLHAGLILSHPLQFRVVERSEASLPEPHRAAAQAARRVVFDQFVNAIQRGMDEGRFRQVDARVATFSIIGMCNWCAWWFGRGGDLSAEQVASIVADFGLHALLPEKNIKQGAQCVGETLQQIKEGLSLLERQLTKVTGP
ncbi:TetR/AcrR family transcriptional regulator [Paraburkholderia steynii]|uniref:TetR/AcrR family transcriptional regulator n=1 Tax=Paraburkholderia steynii TaxID=1245441 RepID=UPI001FC90703|nr:TetR/AcrR family transcriptional regulator [Paraburkholderia steynii]